MIFYLASNIMFTDNQRVLEFFEGEKYGILRQKGDGNMIFTDY